MMRSAVLLTFVGLLGIGAAAACAVPVPTERESACGDECGSKTTKKRKGSTTSLDGTPIEALAEDQEEPPPSVTQPGEDAGSSSSSSSSSGSTPPPDDDPPAPPPVDPTPEPPPQPVAGSCWSGTLSKYLEPGGCYQRKADGIWFQCKEKLWYRNVNNGVGPFGVCTSVYPLAN